MGYANPSIPASEGNRMNSLILCMRLATPPGLKETADFPTMLESRWDTHGHFGQKRTNGIALQLGYAKGGRR